MNMFQEYNMELSYLHSNSHQWLTIVFDTTKLCDLIMWNYVPFLLTPGGGGTWIIFIRLRTDLVLKPNPAYNFSEHKNTTLSKISALKRDSVSSHI